MEMKFDQASKTIDYILAHDPLHPITIDFYARIRQLVLKEDFEAFLMDVFAEMNLMRHERAIARIEQEMSCEETAKLIKLFEIWYKAQQVENQEASQNKNNVDELKQQLAALVNEQADLHAEWKTVHAAKADAVMEHIINNNIVLRDKDGAALELSDERKELIKQGFNIAPAGFICTKLPSLGQQIAAADELLSEDEPNPICVNMARKGNFITHLNMLSRMTNDSDLTARVMGSDLLKVNQLNKALFDSDIFANDDVTKLAKMIRKDVGIRMEMDSIEKKIKQEIASAKASHRNSPFVMKPTPENSKPRKFDPTASPFKTDLKKE